MKKLIYIMLVAVSAALTVVSCTEEEVAPTMENTSTGGSDQGGKI